MQINITLNDKERNELLTSGQIDLNVKLKVNKPEIDIKKIRDSVAALPLKK